MDMFSKTFAEKRSLNFERNLEDITIVFNSKDMD